MAVARVPEVPFLWWGPSGIPPARRNLGWLVEQGTLSAPAAGLLAAAVACRLSLAVVAERSGAGKTTLLTAALARLPPDARRIYPRGQWEPFSFLGEPDVRPERDVLLINEISPHLPGYLWGAGVGRVLDAARLGFAIYATAHAADAAGLCRVLAEPGLSLPTNAAAAFHLVAAIETTGGVRRVSGIWAIASSNLCDVRIVLVCDGAAGLAAIDAGLRRAQRAGWAEDREPPGSDVVAEASLRLDDLAEEGARDAERPGRMLARSRSTRPNGRAHLP